MEFKHWVLASLLICCLCVASGSYVFESEHTTNEIALYNACYTANAGNGALNMNTLDQSLKHFSKYKPGRRRARNPAAGPTRFLQIVHVDNTGTRTLAAWTEYSIHHKTWTVFPARTRMSGVVGEVHYLCVEPNFRGATVDGYRVGRELLNRLREVLKLEVDTRVANTAAFWELQSVPTAANFYANNGFVANNANWPHREFRLNSADNMRGPVLQNRCGAGNAEIVGSAPQCCPGTPSRLAQCHLVANTNTMHSSELFQWPSTLVAPGADVFSCGPCLQVVISYPTRAIPNVVLQLHGTETWASLRLQIAPLVTEVVNVNGAADTAFNHNQAVGMVAAAYPLAVNVV